MRIKPEQYARALFQIVGKKNAAAVKADIGKFAQILVKNNDSKKLPAIISNFNRIWDEAAGVVEVELTGARKIGADAIKSLEIYLVKITGDKEFAIKQQEDKSIFGGVIIKYGDKVIDASLKNRIGNLKNSLMK